MPLRRHASPEDQLARLADGTIGEAQRAELERALAASHELAVKLAEQRRAIAITGAIDIEAPARLLERVAGAQDRPARRARHRFNPRIAIVLVVLLLVAVVLAPRGGSGDVRGVVPFALAAARSPTPAPDRSDSAELDASVSGVSFPNWWTRGWVASGARADVLSGHAVETVFYNSPTYDRVGYSIVAGAALPVGSVTRTVTRAGVAYRVIAADGANVVTWERDGHTCVLAARRAPVAVLLGLAAVA